MYLIFFFFNLSTSHPTDENQKELANIPFNMRIRIALDRITTTYGKKEVFDYAVKLTEGADLEQGVRGTTSTDLLISRKGLGEMISTLLTGIGDYLDSDIDELFSQVDKDSSGFIDREELMAFLHFTTAGLSNQEDTKKIERGLNRSKHSCRHLKLDSLHEQDPDEIFVGRDGNEDVKFLQFLSVDEDRPLRDWSILYCGASSVIETKVKDMKQYGIQVAVEKFDW